MRRGGPRRDLSPRHRGSGGLGRHDQGRGPGGLGEGRAGSSPGRDAGRGLHRLHRPGGDPDRGGPPLQRGHRLRGHHRAGLGRGAGRLVFGAGRLVSQVPEPGERNFTGLPEQRQPGDHFGDHSGSAGPRAGGPQLGGQRDGPGPGERHPRQQSGSAGHRGPDLSAPGGERHRHPLRGAGTV